MKQHLIGAVAALSVLFPAVARCASADPALATPKLAALAFVRAMEADDMDAFRTVTIGADEDYKLFEPLLEMVGAARQMEKAARATFGKAGSAIVRDSPAVELEVHVQESDVIAKDDTAVLRHKGEEDADPLTLRKSETGWKVDLTAIKNRQQMAASASMMRRMRAVFTDITAEIRAAKFKTASDAEKSLLQRMREASSNSPSPAK